MQAPIPAYVPSALDIERGTATPQSIGTVSAQLFQVMTALNNLTPTIDETEVNTQK